MEERYQTFVHLLTLAYNCFDHIWIVVHFTGILCLIVVFSNSGNICLAIFSRYALVMPIRVMNQVNCGELLIVREISLLPRLEQRDYWTR